jgi:hypothetical protein
VEHPAGEPLPAAPADAGGWCEYADAIGAGPVMKHCGSDRATSSIVALVASRFDRDDADTVQPRGCRAPRRSMNGMAQR